MKIFKSVILVAGLSSMLSCKDDKLPEAQYGTVKMEFNNKVGEEQMEFKGSKSYTNANGDDFKITMFKYYVSNIVLKGNDGVLTYVEPESYHLINQQDESTLSFIMEKVPVGSYKSMQVMFGVDSLRNVSGAQTGALDPIHGMFWEWNTGYIMAKMEGSSSKVGTGGGNLSLHLGGFSGQYSVVKTIELPFPNNLEVKDKGEGTIQIKGDALAWFKSPNLIDFHVVYAVGGVGENAYKLGQNALNMFTVTMVK